MQHHDNIKIAKTQGARNWGNSGIKVFNPSASQGIEVQIIDSKRESSEFAEDVNKNTRLNGCSDSCNGYVPFGQICGSVYMKKVAMADSLYEATGCPIPTGEWNKIDIAFTSKRYNLDQTPSANSYLRVTLNGVLLIDAEFEHSISNDLVQIDECLAESGPIILQEHDNMVEFRDVTING